MEYKGYLIEGYEDGTYDILQNGELVDGSFNSLESAKAAVDSYVD